MGIDQTQIVVLSSRSSTGESMLVPLERNVMCAITALSIAPATSASLANVLASTTAEVQQSIRPRTSGRYGQIEGVINGFVEFDNRLGAKDGPPVTAQPRGKGYVAACCFT